MFDLKEFIVTNIVYGVKNGTFTKEYANIMAVNYMLKGVLTEEEIVSVSTQIEAWEAEQAQKSEISVETLFDEQITTEEENVVNSVEYEATEGELAEDAERELDEPVEIAEDGESLN